MHDSWVPYFRTEPPGSSSILQKSIKVLGSIQRVQFTKATQRHANIREDKGPSLGKEVKSNEWCLPGSSVTKLEEREFVVDSGASTHTAKGEVPTKEEATVYVRELDLSLTVQLLEDTPAVLSHGKLCEDHG